MRLFPIALGLVFAASGCRSFENLYGKLDAIERVEHVAYVEDGHPKHTLDLYLPRTKEPFPTVVFVHGGYWRAGDRRYYELATGLYGNVGAALAQQGVGAAVISYRLLPEASLDDMLDDVTAALAWTRDHIGAHGGDPTALFLAGHSAGGHLAAQLGAHPDELRVRGVDPGVVRGVITLSGIYDVEATTARVDPELRDEVFVPLFGADPARQQRASPASGFGPVMTPTLFVVGDSDYRSCEADHAAAERVLAPLTGARAFFHTIAGNTHEDMVLEIGTHADEVTPLVVAFVQRMR